MSASTADMRAATESAREDRFSGSDSIEEFHSAARVLLPRPIVHCGGSIDQWQAPLHPEEEPYVKGSVRRRIREFAAGRHCAHTALEQLGHDRGTPIRMGKRRQPLWPAGVVGSISHGAGYCLAAVCTRNHFAGLGVDIEAATPLSENLVNLVCTPCEREWCESQGSALAGLLAKFHFSAKEAVFKCLYPLFGTELEFHEVHLDLSMHEERFTAQVSRISLGAEADLIVRGRLACTSDVVMTSAALQDEDLQFLPFGFGFSLDTGVHPGSRCLPCKSA